MDETLADPARTARKALAHPHAARLLVDGLTPRGATDAFLGTGVELVDRHGIPLLLCDPAAPLARAADEGRHATLDLVGAEGAAGVVLRGRLEPAGYDEIEDRPVALVELAVDGVRVDRTDVAVDAYLRQPDLALARYAAMVAGHSNDDHGTELVRFVSRLTGTPEDGLAGARIDDLDPEGFSVRFVDLDGAHEIRVLFPRRAATCHDLGRLLCEALCTHRGEHAE